MSGAPPAAPGAAVGLLAGEGRLPVVLAAAMRAQGRRVICAQMAGEPGRLPDLADVYAALDLGALQDLLRFWQQHAVREVVVAGRFNRAALAQPQPGDDFARARLRQIDDRRDQSVMDMFAQVLAQGGMRVLAQTAFAPHLLAEPGLLAGPPPSEAERRDVELGLPIARLLAGQDVGQTVVLKDGAILAAEAAEGTDATIRRGGSMARGAVVVKVSRPHQDPRFDLPTVGPETIESMDAVGARLLAVEARRTIILDRDRLAAAAAAAAITVLAVEAQPLLAAPLGTAARQAT